MPALRRYTGSLYVAAADKLEAALAERLPHLLILSGGYGIVHARDPIGWYERHFRPRDWPSGLLADVIAAYANQYRLSRARVFAAGTTPYARFLEKVPWNAIGLTDVILYSPERTTGAQKKAPRSLGEAVVSIITGEFGDDWRSPSDRLAICSRRLGPRPHRERTSSPWCARL
jgi:hypothetical protein